MATESDTSAVAASEGSSAPVRRGVLAALPFFPGMIAVSITLAISALAQGISTFEAMAMSMLIFAGAAQVAMVSMIGDGASTLSIIATALLLNLRHTLYGLTASRWFDGESSKLRAILAFVFTDELFAIVLTERRRGDASPKFMMAAGWMFYIGFAVSTLLGLLLGDRLSNVDELGLDVVFPVAFIALLVPLIRERKHLSAAIAAGALAIVLSRLVPGGAVILIVTISVAVGAALIETRRDARAG